MIERKGFKTAQRGKRNSSLTQPELFPQCCVSKGPTAPTLLVETETCSGWFVARLCHTNLNPLGQHLWMGFFFLQETQALTCSSCYSCPPWCRLRPRPKRPRLRKSAPPARRSSTPRRRSQCTSAETARKGEGEHWFPLCVFYSLTLL